MARLVAIGDSLTQGFQHAAIRRAEWSYPAIVARAIGAKDFTHADFSAEGFGGPLVDLELFAREFRDVGMRFSLRDAPVIARALASVRSKMDRLEDYWERGAGTRPSGNVDIHHNLAVWGFEILDALTLSDGVCLRNTPPARDDFVMQVPEMGMYRTARRVLNPRQMPGLEELTQLDLAERLGRDSKIGDLIFALGANNALATCLYLELRWSQSADLRKFPHQRRVTIWEPEHFHRIYDLAVARLEKIPAERVYLATVPHVTVAPVTRGVSPRAKELGLPETVSIRGSKRRYFEYYTRFWLWDSSFNPNSHDERITREDAWAVDNAIDEYNAHIRDIAKAKGWALIDFCAALDDLAFRSTGGQPTYRFPKGLIDALAANPKTSFRVRDDEGVILDTRFFRIPATTPADGKWRDGYRGGLFGLDGVHPTTTGYGLMAYETLKVMKAMGVPEADPEALPWASIIEADTLLTDPPPLLASLEETLTFLFKRLGLSRVIQRLSGTGSEP